MEGWAGVSYDTDQELHTSKLTNLYLDSETLIIIIVTAYYSLSSSLIALECFVKKDTQDSSQFESSFQYLSK